MSIQCSAVGPECPVAASPYGYLPSKGANAFFAAFFGTATILQMALGFRWRLWTYMIVVGIGCGVECVGTS